MHPANPMWDSAANFLSASEGSGRGDLHGHLSAALNGAQLRLSGAAGMYRIAIGSAQIGLHADACLLPSGAGIKWRAELS
jgi:hypothetical protein